MRLRERSETAIRRPNLEINQSITRNSPSSVNRGVTPVIKSRLKSLNTSKEQSGSLANISSRRSARLDVLKRVESSKLTRSRSKGRKLNLVKRNN